MSKSISPNPIGPRGSSRPSPSIQPLYINTMNVRSLVGIGRQEELEYALQNINWDILGISEIKKDGTHIIEYEEYIFLYTGKISGRNGVGFMVKQKLKHNIIDFQPISDRVARLDICIERTSLTIIQVYSPTEKSSEEELESFYSDISTALENTFAKTFVIGDFNAKVGQAAPEDLTIMGPYGYGIRNKRGSRLVDFCFENQLYIMNSHFNKKPKNKWTWRSPDGRTLNEIDYFITKKSQVSSLQNIEVISTSHPTDHRMVRATFSIKYKSQKSRRAFKTKQSEYLPIECEHLKNNFVELFKAHRKTDNIQETYTNLIYAIQKSVNHLPKVTNKNKIDCIITEDIMKLISERTELKGKLVKTNSEKTRLKHLYKKIRKRLKENKQNYKLKILGNELDTRRSIKKGNKLLNNTKEWIPTLNTKKGTISTNRNSILTTATEFYQKLYSQQESYEREPNIMMANFVEIPTFLESEIRHAITSLKSMKSPGEDYVTNDTLKVIIEPITPILTKLFNNILTQEKIPEQWETSIITLLYKKGNPQDINNYRPISLLQVIYKLFTKVILHRLKKVFDFQQPREQAGFRGSYSTLDHIFTLNQVIEKYVEYGKNLYVAFVDYTKAFDSIFYEALWVALTDQNVPEKYIKVLKEIYSKSKALIKLQKKGRVFDVKRGVRQGDPISPNLFTALIEYIFRKLDWSGLGININGEHLNHLRFADDIVIIAENPKQLVHMLETLDIKSRASGLEMNPQKTCIMTNGEQYQVQIQGKTIKYVDEYIYLGQTISFEGHYIQEVERRIKKAWSSYWSLKHVFKSQLDVKLKKIALDSVVTPTLLYGCQTWPLTKTVIHKIQVAQRSMERSMLGFKLKDKIKNLSIRKKTKIIDAARLACLLKWRWAGHIARATDDRWTEKILHWYPRDALRSRGRPRRRWRDDITETTGITWTRLARDRTLWKEMEEAYARKWAFQ